MIDKVRAVLGWFNLERRKRIYGLLTLVGSGLVLYNVADQGQVDAWLQSAAWVLAVLGNAAAWAGSRKQVKAGVEE